MGLYFKTLLSGPPSSKMATVRNTKKSAGSIKMFDSHGSDSSNSHTGVHLCSDWLRLRQVSSRPGDLSDTSPAIHPSIHLSLRLPLHISL